MYGINLPASANWPEKKAPVCVSVILSRTVPLTGSTVDGLNVPFEEGKSECLNIKLSGF